MVRESFSPAFSLLAKLPAPLSRRSRPNANYCPDRSLAARRRRPARISCGASRQELTPLTQNTDSLIVLRSAPCLPSQPVLAVLRRAAFSSAEPGPQVPISRKRMNHNAQAKINNGV